MVAVLESVGAMIPTSMLVDRKAVNTLEIVKNTSSKHETGIVFTDLPRYQWDHSSVYWAEFRLSLNARNREFPRHELLGARIPTDISIAPTRRNVPSNSEIHWLKELVDNTPKTVLVVIFALLAFETTRQVQITIDTTSPRGSFLWKIILVWEIVP